MKGTWTWRIIGWEEAWQAVQNDWEFTGMYDKKCVNILVYTTGQAIMDDKVWGNF